MKLCLKQFNIKSICFCQLKCLSYVRMRINNIIQFIKITNYIFMMRKYIFLLLTLPFLLLGCNETNKQTEEVTVETTDIIANDATTEKEAVLLKDYGAEPLVLNIDDYTLSNTNFRTTLWTGKNLQVTLMSIPVGGEVGLELHSDIDQFLRLEAGQGRVLMGDSKENLDFIRDAKEDFAIFVPAGKWHNVINTGDEPMKIYSIYAPKEHPHGTIHIDKEASDADHDH